MKNSPSTIPKHLDKQSTNAAIHQQQIIQFSSPLPPAEILSSYENVQHGLIAKIIEMTEIQGAHRRKLENEQAELQRINAAAQINHIERRDWEAKFGQIFGFSLGVIAIIAGSYVATKGFQWSGSIIGVSGIGGIIGTFIQGRKAS